MKFADIRGNEQAVSVLRSMADSGRIPHAMLLYENPGSGAMAISIAFLQYLCCEHPTGGDSCGECPSCKKIAKLAHPDVHFVFPVAKGDAIKDEHPVSSMALGEFRELFAANPFFLEQDLYDAIGIEGKSGNISVYEAKEIINTLSLSAVEGRYKAIVMFLPEKMNVQAANKLLKILEEPPEKTIFLLITQNPEDVMSTIFSRCQGLRILPFDSSQLVCGFESDEISSIWNDLCNALANKDLYSALNCADAIAGLGSREKQKAFCTFASEQIRKSFLCSHALEDIAYLADGQTAVKGFSSKFCMRSAAALDKAAMLIGRNVSAKIVFTDLVNRLYVNL